MPLSDPGNRKWIWRVELMACGIGFAIPVLQWCFTGQMTVRVFIEQWLFSAVYGNCVGWIMWTAMPSVFARTDALAWGPRWLLRTAAIVASTAVGCLIAGLAPWAVYREHYEYWPNFLWSFRLSVIIAACVTAFIDAYERMRDRLRVTELQLKNKELERERALKLATEARLASLESRIHPHFLFNTINSVSSLIHEEPDRAERLLTQMASLLRFSLDSAQAGLVPLDREMKIVKDYLDIETARFNGRLRYEIDVPSDLSHISVPPLAVQTLVENSVKYAVSPRRGGGNILVAARRQDSTVSLEVTDDGPGFERLELPAGHGLSNLQERLYTLFGDNAALDIASTAPGASVRLRVPLLNVPAVPR